MAHLPRECGKTPDQPRTLVAANHNGIDHGKDRISHVTSCHAGLPLVLRVYANNHGKTLANTRNTSHFCHDLLAKAKAGRGPVRICQGHSVE
jgi:hypothetical protein